MIDYPHSTRAKKFFLVLMVGSSGVVPAAKGLDGSEPEADEVEVAGRQHSRKKRKRSLVSAVGFCQPCPARFLLLNVSTVLSAAKHAVNLQMSSRHPDAKGKSWIFKKKDQMRKQGYTNIPVDTKYTGRKRKSRF